MKTLCLLFLLAALLPSCSTTSGGGGSGTAPPKYTPRTVIKLDPKKAEWNSMADVRAAFAGKPVRISGTTLDLNNCEISGAAFPKPKDPQDEGSAGIHARIPGFYLQNGYVTGVPGGIVCKGKGITVYDIQFRSIGEDALSNQVDETPGMRVLKSRFYNGGGGDKSLQMNDGNAAEIRDCYFTGGITGARIQKKATRQRNKATVSGNTFDGVNTAWNIAGNVKVAASGNKYHGVTQRWVTDSGATFTEK